MSQAPSPTRPLSRGALLVLLLVIAVNALGGGVFGLFGAPGVPTAWLAGSPFEDYRVPSLVLLVVVGGAHVAAAVEIALRRPHARRAALAAGLVLGTWIAVQIAVIGYVSWLQPAMAVCAALVLALASRLPEAAARAAQPAPRGTVRASR